MLTEMRKKNYLLVSRGSVNCVALKDVHSLCALMILRAMFYVFLYFSFLLNKESSRLRGGRDFIWGEGEVIQAC